MTLTNYYVLILLTDLGSFQIQTQILLMIFEETINRDHERKQKHDVCFSLIYTFTCKSVKKTKSVHGTLDDNWSNWSYKSTKC